MERKTWGCKCTPQGHSVSATFQEYMPLSLSFSPLSLRAAGKLIYQSIFQSSKLVHT